MRRIELKSKGWVSSAKVDFIKEGMLRGALAVHVEMAGDASKGSFEEVAFLVERLLAEPLPQRKMVRFSGVLVDHDPNFTLLVKSLFDYGFSLQVVMADCIVYSWLQWMSWVVVRTDRHVVMTQCDELWLQCDTPPTGDVTLPLRPDKTTFCYITGRLPVDEVDAFMCRSRHMWGLL